MSCDGFGHSFESINNDSVQICCSVAIDRAPAHALRRVELKMERLNARRGNGKLGRAWNNFIITEYANWIYSNPWISAFLRSTADSFRSFAHIKIVRRDSCRKLLVFSKHPKKFKYCSVSCGEGGHEGWSAPLWNLCRWCNLEPLWPFSILMTRWGLHVFTKSSRIT